jgi:hypothetical protein
MLTDRDMLPAPMQWLRKAGWAKALTARMDDDSEIGDTFYSLLTVEARMPRAKVSTGRSADQYVSMDDPEYRRAALKGFAGEVQIAFAMDHFMMHGHRIVRLDEESVRACDEATITDITARRIVDLVGREGARYIRTPGSTTLAYDGKPMDGLLVLPSFDEQGREAVLLMPMPSGPIALGENMTIAPSVSFLTEGDQDIETAGATAMEELARSVASQPIDLAINFGRGRKGPSQTDDERDDMAESVRLSMEQIEIARREWPRWIRMLEFAVASLDDDAPCLMAYPPEAPADLVAKATTVGTGQRKAQQKLAAAGWVREARYDEASLAELAKRSAEAAATLPDAKTASTTAAKEDEPEATKPTPQGPPRQIENRRKAKRHAAKAAIPAIAPTKGAVDGPRAKPETVVDLTPDEAPIDDEPTAGTQEASATSDATAEASIGSTSTETFGAWSPAADASDEDVPPPCQHDPELLESIHGMERARLRDIPSMTSRNWEATLPAALASLAIRRARVASMPRESAEATRRRLSADILPRLEGMPALTARFESERKANPDLATAYRMTSPSVIREFDPATADAAAHPIHVLVEDEAIRDAIMFPGVRPPLEGRVPVRTVVTAWRDGRTFHLVGIVQHESLIGYRRVEIDMVDRSITQFDSDDDDPQTRIAALLHSPIADAVLGAVEPWETWRYEIAAADEATGDLARETDAARPCDGEGGSDIAWNPSLEDLGSWETLSFPVGNPPAETREQIEDVARINAVLKAVACASGLCSPTETPLQSAMRRHLWNLSLEADPEVATLSSPDFGDADLTGVAPRSGVVIVSDRVLFEHASPGLFGPVQTIRETPLCILYRLDERGLSALIVQIGSDMAINLVNWVTMPLSPAEEDDDLVWYVRGAVAAVTPGDHAPTPSAQPEQTRAPLSGSAGTDGEFDDAPVLGRVVAQVRLRPANMAIAEDAAAQWFDAQVRRHGPRLVRDVRRDGEWLIENRSDDRQNADRWSVTLRLAQGDPTSLDVVVRTTVASGVKPRLPTLVRDIVRRTPCEGPDGPLTLRPDIILSRGDLNRFLRDVQSPERVLPILLMSQAPDGLWPRDPEEIAGQIVGAATPWLVVDRMTSEISYALGQEYRTFNGAVRAFQPRFDPDVDMASRHPRIMFDSGIDRALGDLTSRLTAGTVTRYAITEMTHTAAEAAKAVPAFATPRAVEVIPKTRVLRPSTAPEPISSTPKRLGLADLHGFLAKPLATAVPIQEDAAPHPADAVQAPAQADLTPPADPSQLRIAPEDVPAPDAKTIARMVEEAVSIRMAELAAASEAAANEAAARLAEEAKAIPAEPVPEPEPTLFGPELPPVPAPSAQPVARAVTDEDLDRAVEDAVARRMASTGVTELVGVVGSLVAEMRSMTSALPAILAQAASSAPSAAAVLPRDDRDEVIAALRLELQAERDSAENLLEEASALKDAAVSETQNLRKVLNDRRRQEDHPEGDDHPETLSGLLEWIERNPLPNVTLTSKCIRSMRKVDYRDMERLCSTLRLLDTAYVDMRAGIAGAKTKWDDGLKELRLENRKQTQMGMGVKGGAEYRFQHDGQNWEMEFHLRGIESLHNETARLLRIYFAFDKEQGRVLIAHMPTHLTTVDS